MNLYPQFPAVLDSTIIKAWKSCPRKCYYEHFCGLREQDPNMSTDLVAGKAFAKGLETARKAFYFGSMSASNAIDEGQIALGMEYGPDRSGEKKNLPRVRNAFTKYFDIWPLDKNSGIVPVEDGVEKSFSIPIPGLFHPDTDEPLHYAGRIDMLGEQKSEIGLLGYDESSGGLYGVDEKTTGSINSTFFTKYDLDWQMLGYHWAYRQLGLELQGIKVRGIGLTNRKEIDITQDYKETVVLYNENIISDWFSELLFTANQMLDFYTKNKGEDSFPQAFGNACSDYARSCAYKPICSYFHTLPEYQIIRWNPLERK